MRNRTESIRRATKITLWIVAFFYAYGALVHLLNILSLTGFNWIEAPLKWQILDIVYLGLDLMVAVGFVAAWKSAYLAFYAAAISQILLYTVFREWIVDVPDKFAVSVEQVSYLDTLVVFHVVTLLCVSIVLRYTRSKPTQ